jgi:hypothetical protein
VVAAAAVVAGVDVAGASDDAAGGEDAASAAAGIGADGIGVGGDGPGPGARAAGDVAFIGKVIRFSKREFKNPATMVAGSPKIAALATLFA